MSTNACRKAQKVFRRHAEEAVFITRAGVLRGKEGAREGFAKLLRLARNGKIVLQTVLLAAEPVEKPSQCARSTLGGLRQ